MGHFFQLSISVLLLTSLAHAAEEGAVAKLSPRKPKPVIAQKGCLTSGCHGELYQNQTVIHGPLKAHECAVCHFETSEKRPKNQADKTTAHKNLVKFDVANVNSTCLTCHDQIRDALKLPKNPHAKLAEKGCVFCHNPHASTRQKLLKVDVFTAKCLTCHDKMKKDMEGFTTHHGPLDTEKSCVSCHNIHEPAHPKLLKTQPEKICLECHSKEIDTKKGRIIKNMGELLKKSAFLHTPVKNGKCTACHGPHGATMANLTDSELSKDFYGTFSVARFQLCFDCHNPDLASKEIAKSDDETKFRNGSKNLHFFHLQRGQKGLSCLTCHDVHAAMQAAQIRSGFVFQGVEVPMKYNRLETGGNCTNACHGQKNYDRVKEMVNEKGR